MFLKLFSTAIIFACSLVHSGWVVAQPAPPNRDQVDVPDPAYQVIIDPTLVGFEKFVDAELKKWNVPGIAITVVKDGKVIMKRGFGLRDIEKNLPMTQFTVQPIASVTKSFTVASLASLVRAGKLSWDRPVREYLHDFKMYNDYTTLNATPRDLLTHRTGLPRHDSSWYNATATREELYKRIQYLEPSAQLRATMQYNNFMYMTAGYMGGKVAGSDWESLVRTNIFAPLGMFNSTFSIDDMQKAQHVAKGYKWDEKEQPTEIPYRGITAMGPTGSINSNMEDMSRYLRLYLGRGEFEGKTILNAADIVEMTNPQMVMADARRYEEIAATQYGMGFFLTHYRGERLVHHGGNMPGASSLLSFMPQKNIGVFTTANLSGSSLPSIVTYAIYDRLLGLKPVDWSGRFWDNKEKAKASEHSAKKQNLSPQKTGTKPAHALSAYAGRYHHPGYGTVQFSDSGAQLTGRLNDLSSPFAHYHYDVFVAPNDKLNDMANTKVQFITDLDGDVSAVHIGLEPSVKPIAFTRQPYAHFRDVKFLQKFAGEYQLGNTTIIIGLRDDAVLTLATPGQPTRELVGIRGQRFNVKTSNGFSIEFTSDKTGKIDQAAFYQPNGNFVATRK